MTVSIDKDRYDQSWMVGILTKVVILLFHFSRVDVLEDILKNEAVMIRGQQIENVRGKHKVLVKVSGVSFEFDR